MSPAEIAWRIQSMARDRMDRLRFALGLYPYSNAIRVAVDDKNVEPPFRVSDVRLGDWVSPQANEDEAIWCEDLNDRAKHIAAHRFSFFDLKNHYMGDPIDWNRDHSSGTKAPMIYAQLIDYRDFNVTGDCKLVWEPNRHHQLVVLGRAHRATGKRRYADAVAEQLDSWLRQNPFGKGMNWRSPLELGIRLINWVWSIDLIHESGALTGELRERVLHAVYLHCWEITRKYSVGSSANNHLVGEAAGVFVATTYFRRLPHATRWRTDSRLILEREIELQTYPDGCTREQALGYQLFVIQLYLFSGMVARWVGEDFSPGYWSRLEKMLEFVGSLTEGGEDLPMFGDDDDGYVLDLGGLQRDPRYLLGIGAVLFSRSDFKTWSRGYGEPLRWLLGHPGHEQFKAIAAVPPDQPLCSRAFEASGHYLLQSGVRGSQDRISVFFDCGELGYGSIAAHGHADALSFTLRAFGADVFVDPGTYVYFGFPMWRHYFRSTRAHNTVVVDETDQSVILGPFMWGRRANARCTRWEPRAHGGTVAGEHDGYTRFADPVVHRRTLDLDGVSSILIIRDEIEARAAHLIAVCFHLAESCAVTQTHNNSFQIAVGGGSVMLELDPYLTPEILTASDTPAGGWISRGYHQKIPSTTLIGHGICQGSTTLNCRIMMTPTLPKASSNFTRRSG